MLLNNIETIYQFTNGGITYGVYKAIYNGTPKVFIVNGDSIGVVSHWKDEPASKCVNEVTQKIKNEIMENINITAK